MSYEEKMLRGTLKPSREAAYAAQAAGFPDEVPAEVPDPAAPRRYEAEADGYIEDVLGGTITAGRWARAACARQKADKARQHDPFWPYVWDGAAGARACHFIECCPHVEGTWASPFIVLEPWQTFLIMALFGWRQKADRGKRRFTSFYLEVGRKAAKSTLMAAIAYYHLLRENEPGASVVCAATTGKQARMVFEIMQRQGRKSLWLKRQGVDVMANSIATADGSVKPVNSKASSLDGLNPSCIVLDESHAQSFGLHDVLKSAQGARGNPLLMCPTTAGYDLLSVGYAMHGQVAKVLDGVYQAEHLLGIIYCLDTEDDWRDPAVWQKANPMLGISPSREFITKYCADAQQANGMEGEFKVKSCCLWASSAASWLSMTAWDKCARPGLRLEQFIGKACWIGCDLAQVDDLCASAYLFEDGDTLVAFVVCYLPRDVVEERARFVPAYREWAQSGLLVLTDGPMTDYNVIEARLKADAARFKVQEIVFDQFGSAQISASLAAAGLPAVLEPKNAKTTTPPAKELEARVKHGRFAHDGNSLLKWAASNVVVRRGVDDTILPKKESAESPNKIDPIDALVAALGSWLRGKKPAKEYKLVIIGGHKP